MGPPGRLTAPSPPSRGPDLRILPEGILWTAEAPGFLLRLRREPDGTFVPASREVPAGEEGVALLGAAARALADTVRAGAKQVLSWEREKDAAWNAALDGAGFRVHRRKLFVRKDLAGPLPAGGPFAWRTLAEAGEGEFRARLLAASEGDPFEEDVRDPDAEWKELLEHAGDAFDPVLWRIALLDGAAAGVVLPTVFPEVDPLPGTCSYLGLLPPFRGRGLGRALHAEGLRLLAGAGARVYKGSTDERNLPMARVFAGNGCEVVGVQLLLRPG